MTNRDEPGLHEWMHAHGPTLDAIAHDTGVTRDDVRYLAVLVIAGLSDDQIASSWNVRPTVHDSNPYASVDEAVLELRTLAPAA